MKDYYSVIEFAKLSGVKESTLRYWDRVGIFQPLKRNPENNYRYYSPAQITTVNFISTLSNIGIPVKTIAAIRKSRNPEVFLALLEKKERVLDKELRILRESISIIHAKEVMIRYGLRVDEEKISVVYKEEEWSAILWPRNEYQDGETFIEPLSKFVNQAKRHRINLSFPIGGRYDNMESFIKAPAQPNHFFSVDPTGVNVRRSGEYVVGFARGYYGELGDLPDRMEVFIRENNLQVTGHVYLTYLHDEACFPEPDNYLAQAMVAVGKSRRRK